MNEENLLELFRQEPDHILTLEQVMTLTSTPLGELKTMRRALKRLVRNGDLMRLRGRRYRLTPPPDETKTSPVVMGSLRKVGRTLYIEPGKRGGDPILIEDPPGDLEDGLIVRYEIVTPRTRARAPTARIVEVIGKPGDRNVEMTRLMTEHGLDVPFPDSAIAEADAFGPTVDAVEANRRRDLRDLNLVTIDGADAKDFDDAVCVERREDGRYTLYVAIADVSHYVRPSSPLDREAYRRGTSTYLTDRCIPMLPEALSNNLCSLRPNEDRLCVVAELIIDSTGRTHKTMFYRAVMRSKARLTYEQVAAALDGEADDACRALMPSLLRLFKVAKALLEHRLKRGALDLDVPEPVLTFDNEGFPTDSKKRERNAAHRLIEDLMLAANEAVASFLLEKKHPSLFRIHEDPDRDKLMAFIDLGQTLGLQFKLRKKITPRDVASLSVKIAELETGAQLQWLLLRSMAQARYDPQNVGHFGLAAENYTHFTSPIRRYPDLMVHRALMAEVNREGPQYKKGELKEIGEHTSTRERAAMSAERASVDLDRALVASSHVGKTLQATVNGIQGFGMFVTVDEPFVDGMIPASSLPSDYYESDDIGSRLTGQSTGTTYLLGQRLEVEIVRVDLEKRRVEMRIAGMEAPARTSPRRRGRPPGDRDRERPAGRKRGAPAPRGRGRKRR